MHSICAVKHQKQQSFVLQFKHSVDVQHTSGDGFSGQLETVRRSTDRVHECKDYAKRLGTGLFLLYLQFGLNTNISRIKDEQSAARKTAKTASRQSAVRWKVNESCSTEEALRRSVTRKILINDPSWLVFMKTFT